MRDSRGAAREQESGQILCSSRFNLTRVSIESTGGNQKGAIGVHAFSFRSRGLAFLVPSLSFRSPSRFPFLIPVL